MQKLNQVNGTYLSGGGNEKQSFPLDELFFRQLPDNGRLLYIPLALRRHKLYQTVGLWMKSVLELHKRVDLKFEVLDKLSGITLAHLRLFDAIYIGGGNTWSLMKEIQETAFSEVLTKYVRLNRAVYGGSAGAIVLGERIDTQDDNNDVGWDDNYGMRLLGGYSVTCHFKQRDRKKYKNWSIVNNLPIICLPDEAGLILENEKAKCIGRKPCTIFLSTGKEITVSPKVKLQLKKSASASSEGT